jgi:gamma-glutamyl-gamma-aminobutyrate hydrolase PuuD
MAKTKPLIGILPVPYIKNDKSNNMFLKENLISFLKINSLDHIIIPYTIKKVELNKLLPNLDGLLFPGSQLGNYFNNKFIKQHSMQLLSINLFLIKLLPIKICRKWFYRYLLSGLKCIVMG